MSTSTPSKPYGRLHSAVDDFATGWNRIGGQMRFYAETLAAIPDAVLHYRTELLRLIAQMGLGSGALVVVGGTVAIVGFLTMTTGALVAVQGYNQLATVGFEALTTRTSNSSWSCSLRSCRRSRRDWWPTSAPSRTTRVST